MNRLLTIELTNLRFFARHGLYDEEIKTGNEFEVNLSVSFVPDIVLITDVETTINYVALYEFVKAAMQKPSQLLETVAMETAETIHQIFPQVKKINISISKLHPPIKQFNGAVCVRYEKEY